MIRKSAANISPYAFLIKGSSKSLPIIDIDESPYNKQSVVMIVQALLDSAH